MKENRKMRTKRFVYVLFTLIVGVVGGTVALGKVPQIKTGVTEVVVPVSVKDRNGRLVTSLKGEDFTITEDGKRQTLSQFSTDEAPLSAVVLIDTGMGGDSLRSLSETWPLLSQAFHTSDEVATYRFDHIVMKLGDFTNDPAAV